MCVGTCKCGSGTSAGELGDSSSFPAMLWSEPVFSGRNLATLAFHPWTFNFSMNFMFLEALINSI